MKHFYLAGMTIQGGQINQVQEQDFDPGVQEVVNTYDGQVDPTFAAVMMQRTRIGLTSTALALVLGLVPIGGLAYSSTAADMYYQPAAAGGTRDTTACFKTTSAAGLMCLQSISADEGSTAQVSIGIYPISSDGLTAPLTMTVGETLPSPIMTRQEFTVGPVKINGTLIDGVKSTRIDFGVNVEQDQANGVPYPTLAHIGTRQPRQIVRTTDVDLVQSLGLFTGVTSSKCTTYFRKMAAAGTRVPNATAQHVSLAASGGIIIARRISGGNGSPAMAEIEIPITYDGTNAVVAVNTATAIS